MRGRYIAGKWYQSLKIAFGDGAWCQLRKGNKSNVMLNNNRRLLNTEKLIFKNNNCNVPFNLIRKIKGHVTHR